MPRDRQPRPDFTTAAPDFVTRALDSPPPRMLVNDILGADGATLISGQPRDLKSWVALEELVALTTGTPAFGGAPWTVPEPLPALYVTNEDGQRRVAERLSCLLRGRDLHDVPARLRLAVRAGVWLDDVTWQQQLFDWTTRHKFAVVCLDPLRSVTATVDGGPKDLAPFRTFVTNFLHETGAALLLVHHNVKPPVGENDTRKKPQRASGGGLFSLCDAPIAAERLDGNRTLLTPSLWKGCADPSPVLFELQTDDARTPTWARLVGQVWNDGDGEDAALQLRVLEFLKHNPGASGSRVAQGVRAQKDATLRALRALDTAGRVDSFEAGRAVRWFVHTNGSMVPERFREPCAGHGSMVPPLQGGEPWEPPNRPADGEDDGTM